MFGVLLQPGWIAAEPLDQVGNRIGMARDHGYCRIRQPMQFGDQLFRSPRRSLLHCLAAFLRQGSKGHLCPLVLAGVQVGDLQIAQYPRQFLGSFQAFCGQAWIARIVVGALGVSYQDDCDRANRILSGLRPQCLWNMCRYAHNDEGGDHSQQSSGYLLMQNAENHATQ